MKVTLLVRNSPWQNVRSQRLRFIGFGFVCALKKATVGFSKKSDQWFKASTSAVSAAVSARSTRGP
jgi:hypothetical protein